MKNKNAYKTIFVDITKDSGYTQENVYKLDVNSALKNSESKFDLSLFIFARKTDRLNDSDKYITKIVWDYDSDSCFDEKTLCPDTLIWSSTTILADWDENSNSDTSASNQWIPYPVNWY